MFRRAFVGAVVVTFISFVATHVMAATVNGTVESVSTDDNTVSVKVNGKGDEPKVFTVGPAVIIMIDGKKGTLEDVVAGQTVTVTANATNTATKLLLKSPKTPPASRKPGKKPPTTPALPMLETGRSSVVPIATIFRKKRDFWISGRKKV